MIENTRSYALPARDLYGKVVVPQETVHEFRATDDSGKSRRAEVHTVEPVDWRPYQAAELVVYAETEPDEYAEVITGKVRMPLSEEAGLALAQAALNPSKAEIASLTKVLNDRPL